MPEREAAEITPIKVTQSVPLRNNEKLFKAAHAVDKDLATVALSSKVNGVAWLKLELGKSQFIHKFVIHHRFYTNWFNSDQWCQKSLGNFKSCIDDDNNVDVSVYRKDVKQKSCGTLQMTYGLKQSDQIYTLDCGIEGDSVKLSKTSFGNVAVTEIIITGIGRCFF